MKKLLAMAVLAAAAASIVPASAGHADRTITATIVAPTAESGGSPVSRHARCMGLLNGPNDIVGHFEPLDGDEGDGGHAFTLTGTADFDIVFYSNLGTCDAEQLPPTSSGTFNGVGDEAADIPAGSIAAIVVFKPAAPNQTFTLSIG